MKVEVTITINGVNTSYSMEGDVVEVTTVLRELGFGKDVDVALDESTTASQDDGWVLYNGEGVPSVVTSHTNLGGIVSMKYGDEAVRNTRRPSTWSGWDWSEEKYESNRITAYKLL